MGVWQVLAGVFYLGGVTWK